MSERVDVAVHGGRLAADRLGAATATGAPLLLAIHGITSTSRTWLATARALGDRATLMAVDLRGRGRSIELPWWGSTPTCATWSPSSTRRGWSARS